MDNKISSLKLIPMTLDHLPHVLEIERASFVDSYSIDIFKEELRLDIAFPKVLFDEDQMVGFVDYWLVKDEIHLINIAVDPVFRKRGYGSKLLTHLDEVAHEHEVAKIFLDVRKSNAEAIHLYEKFGYKTIKVRKKYYSDNQEDAFVMLKELSV